MRLPSTATFATVLPGELPQPAHWAGARRLCTAAWSGRQVAIAALAIGGIAAHLALRFGTGVGPAASRAPLWVVLIAGGVPLVGELLVKLCQRRFGSDLLAGLSIVTAVPLGQPLAGALVVLMLSGGEALEGMAVHSASSVLRALAGRMPSVGHRRAGSRVADVPLSDVAGGDELVVFPHEVCPVDGVVTEGHGAMDESYLTGEPFRLSKAPGASVLSGAINGDAALTVRAEARAVDSRYARITRVMRDAERDPPAMRRLGDRLGAWYTPLAVALAAVAWAVSGRPDRFLAVLVVATPCPLLIAIPVAIIGAVSLAARRGIVVRRPAVLEEVAACRTVIFDKTGTLTYGRPRMADVEVAPGHDRDEVLRLAVSLERYSKHPLARAVLPGGRRGPPRVGRGDRDRRAARQGPPRHGRRAARPDHRPRQARRGRPGRPATGGGRARVRRAGRRPARRHAAVP